VVPTLKGSFGPETMKNKAENPANRASQNGKAKSMKPENAC
jgi:hypothetical protein